MVAVTSSPRVGSEAAYRASTIRCVDANHPPRPRLPKLLSLRRATASVTPSVIPKARRPTAFHDHTTTSGIASRKSGGRSSGSASGRVLDDISLLSPASGQRAFSIFVLTSRRIDLGFLIIRALPHRSGCGFMREVRPFPYGHGSEKTSYRHSKGVSCPIVRFNDF